MEALNDELLATSEALRKGKKRDRIFSRLGWTFHTVKAPISSTSEIYGLNRELQLYQAQKVPEATFGDNCVELRHDASGVVLSFCALEALRAWCSFQASPVQLPSGKSVDWDWTFTTPYTGSIAVAPLGVVAPLKPDSSSVFARPELNLACGKAKLRNPLCNCRGTPRPVLSIPSSGTSKQRLQQQDSPWLLPPVSPPSWERVEKVELDWQALLRSEQPVFVDQVDLFQDDMHDFGLSHCFVRVYVASTFWMVTLRFFLRVESLCSRVIESRFICRFRENKDAVVLRQCSWKEGDWASLVGPDRSVGLEHLNDSVASLRLPEKQASVYDQVTFPVACLNRTSTQLPEVRWTRTAHFRGASCAVGDLVVVADGIVFEAMSASTGISHWSNTNANDADILSLCLTQDGSKLAVGDECGIAQIFEAVSGTSLLRLDLAPASAMNTSRWLERIAWSSDCKQLSFAAGRVVVVVEASGNIECKHEEQSSISAISFMPNGSLAVAAYGGVRVLKIASSELGNSSNGDSGFTRNRDSFFLERAAASVQCVAISPNGKQLAAGCLDKTMRVFSLDGDSAPVDWVGFNGPIVSVAWSASGLMLAACAGNALLVIESVATRGDAPVLCRGCGVPESDGGIGSCPRLIGFAWCPAHSREHIIAASSANGSVLVFNVASCDHSVPRRCTPLFEIYPSGSGRGLHIDLLEFTRSGMDILVGTDDTLRSYSIEGLTCSAHGARYSNITFVEGDKVVLTDLANRPELNDQEGVLVRYCLDKGRWQVRVGRSLVLLKASNLRKAIT